DHGRRADHRSADEHRLRGSFERIACAVVGLEIILRAREGGTEAEVAINLLLDSGKTLDLGELENGLRIVCDRPVRVDRDRDRPHAEETEGHETECEDRGGYHDASGEQSADRGRD